MATLIQFAADLASLAYVMGSLACVLIVGSKACQVADRRIKAWLARQAD